ISWRRDDGSNPYPSNGEASVLLHEMMTPKQIPPELRRIYCTFERSRGVIVSYNNDRVVDDRCGLRLIAPHGQRAKTSEDPLAWEKLKRAAYAADISVPIDFHLPVPEQDAVRISPDYDEAVMAWRAARSIVFIGYAF